MSLGINSLLSNIDDKMKMFRANPEQARQRAKMTGSTLDAIAAEKVLNDKMDAANELKRQLPGGLSTIVDQNDQELQGMAVQELADGIGKIFQVNQAKKQKNLNKIASMGLAGAPVQKRMAMADGGIVGYQAGNTVGTDRGRAIEYIQSRDDLSVEQKKELFDTIMRTGKLSTAGVGTLSSARPKGLFGSIPFGYETSGLDVMSDANAITQGMALDAASKDKEVNVEVAPNVFEKQIIPGKKLTESEKSMVKAGDTSLVGGVDALKPKLDTVTVPKKDTPPFAGPVDPTELFDQITPKEKEEVSPETPPAADDTPEERTKKVNAYERWFDNLLTVLSAPPTGRGLGGGNVARALLQNKQKVFENDLAADKLDIEEKKADALVELNKLEAEKLSFNKLMALQTSVLEAIQKIRADVDGGMLGIQREGIRTKLLKAQQENDPEKIAELQEQLRDIDVMMKSAVRKAAQAYQGPLASNGLFAQLAAIEQLLGLRGSQGGIPSGFQNKLNVVKPGP
jgi:DNA-directed RNA polymerase subunit F